MNPHPDFQTSTLPRQAELRHFVLTPLTPAQTEEDFEVVSQSQSVLSGVFGDPWPKGLTLEENRIDLAWHDREFTTKRSFAWIVRDRGGAYLGCAYLYPDIGERGRGRIQTWIRDMPDRRETLAELNAALAAWIAPYLPEGYQAEWASNDQ